MKKGSFSHQAIIRLKKAGLIALLQGDFPLQEIIEIGDALLAAPVLALEIDLHSRHALEAITELDHRAGPHMLIGAGGVNTVKQAEVALRAGAQFTASATFASAVVAYSQTRDWLHLPGISSLIEAQQAAATGCRLVKLISFNEGTTLLQTCRETFKGIDFIATGEISLDNIDDYAQAGAVAVMVGRWLIPEPYRSMAEIISAARALLAAWAQAQQS